MARILSQIVFSMDKSDKMHNKYKKCRNIGIESTAKVRILKDRGTLPLPATLPKGGVRAAEAPERSDMNDETRNLPSKEEKV